MQQHRNRWGALRQCWLAPACPPKSATARWEDLSWANGRKGTLLITHGKDRSRAPRHSHCSLKKQHNKTVRLSKYGDS
jgi:hypothetical protein